MASIKAVAKRAQVSVSTVSHVVNGTRFVSPEKTAQVRRAIEELNYKPSFLAKALKGQKTQTLGMLVTTSTNPFFAEVLLGVEQACHKAGYSLLLGNAGDSSDQQLKALKTLTAKQIDALVIMTTNRAREFVQAVERLVSLPTVILDSEPLAGGCAIGDDSYLGGRLAARHLKDRGHSRIAVITGPESHDRSDNRLRGFESELGRTVPTELKAEGQLDVASGYEATKAVLASKARPTAIFAFNDLMALGAYRAASELNIDIPRELAVIGYDDIEIARYLNPPLSTIRQSAFEMGTQTGELLVDHLVNGSELSGVYKLTPQLVVRDST